MSALSMSQNLTAIKPNLNAYFLANGGTVPYTYSVRPHGAGGSINSATGFYTAPVAVSSNPKHLYDFIQVEDDDGNIIVNSILIGSPLHLLREIIQRQMGLPDSRIYFWDQKIFQPTDDGIYIAIGVVSCKPFSNNLQLTSLDSDTLGSNQYSSWQAIVSLDVISRDFSAVNLKEQILMALVTNYAQSQQEINSFQIGKLPPGSHFVNLSGVDGAAIPYRFNISVSLSYAATFAQAIPSYGTFTDTIATNP